jgi:hypothetical protein
MVLLLNSFPLSTTCHFGRKDAFSIRKYNINAILWLKIESICIIQCPSVTFCIYEINNESESVEIGNKTWKKC